MVAKKSNQKILTELKRIEAVEYGLKEFIHGVLIGLIIGFFLAMIFLKWVGVGAMRVLLLETLLY